MSNLRVDELESLTTGRSVLVDKIDTDVRQDLANPDKGARMVARAVLSSANKADLQGIPTDTLVDGAVAQLVKGGLMTWDKGKNQWVPGGGEYLVYRVPEDFISLSEAFKFLGNSNRVAGGNRHSSPVMIRLSSGYVVEEPLTLRYGDYSFIRIEAEDPIVPVSPLIQGVLFTFEYGHAPALCCLFDMGGAGGGGVRYTSSVGFINLGAGVVNAGGRHGLYVAGGSVVEASQSVWDGAAARGCRISNASICRLRDASAQNCTEEGLAVEGSLVTAIGANFSGSAIDNIVVSGASVVSMGSAIATGAGNRGISASGPCIVHAQGADLKGARKAIETYDLATVNASHADLRGSGTHACHARGGSKINVSYSQVSDNTFPAQQIGLMVVTGGEIIALGGVPVKNCGTYALRAENSGKIVADGADASDAGIASYFVQTGGVISGIDTVGPLGSNAPLNALSAIGRGCIITHLRTRNKSSVILPAGSTSVTVPHGLEVQPSPNDVSITARTSLRSASSAWVDAVNEESFQIRVDVASDEDLRFNWSVSARDY